MLPMPIPYTVIPVWKVPQRSCYVSACAAVIDIEALVMRDFVLVEQIGFLIVDYFGRELYAKKFIVEQPLTAAELTQRYSIDPMSLQTAIGGYVKVTGDSYIHPKSHTTYTWRGVCSELHEMIRQYKPILWAKGANLERRVFGREYIINDLQDYNCPKYPQGKLHDPLAECRFFAQFIPF